MPVKKKKVYKHITKGARAQHAKPSGTKAEQQEQEPQKDIPLVPQKKLGLRRKIRKGRKGALGEPSGEVQSASREVVAQEQAEQAERSRLGLKSSKKKRRRNARAVPASVEREETPRCSPLRSGECEGTEGTVKPKPKRVKSRPDEEPEPHEPKKKLKVPENERKETERETGETAEMNGDCVEDLETMCLKVCAANLPYWFDKSRIWRHFRRAGTIQHVWLLWDQWSGESRGIAFITFADKSSVKAALEYDGTTVGGSVIRVNLATDREGEKGKAKESEAVRVNGGWGGGGSWGSENPDGKQAGGNGGKGGKGQSKGKNKSQSPSAPLALADKPEGSLGLMARGLSFDVTEADLQELFASCGSGPTRVRILIDKATGQSKGKAFIDFADEAALTRAAELNDQMLRGRKLRLEFSKAVA